MRMKHKAWTQPFLENHPELVILTLDLNGFPSLSQECALEIGTGRGDFIIQMAEKFPHLFWIGIEMNADALAICAKKVLERQLTNVLLIRDDFSRIAMYLPEHLFSRIYLNFSDPWPKKRHGKRRLTSPSFLSQYQRILAKYGRIYQKTDNASLYQYSLEQFQEMGWKILLADENYSFLEKEDAMSEYERKFRSLGQPIHRLVVAMEEEK